MILSHWIKETGRTVDGFAEEMGVARQTVHRWIGGSRFPKRAVIIRIEKISDGRVAVADWFPPASEAAE